MLCSRVRGAIGGRYVPVVLRPPGRAIAVVTLLLVGLAATVALHHFDNIPAYLTLAPGYLVQSWLFERHWALGGLGYQATMVGVSAIVWTLILLGLVTAFRLLLRLVRRVASS